MNSNKFGLIGKNIGYSFSRSYFSNKFEKSGLKGYSYENFDIPNITEFLNIIEDNPELKGLNITIPYKESVIPFLDKLSKKAAQIGAVNTVCFTKKGELKGFNTDYYGFKKSIVPLLEPHHEKALILGTGGAAKAIAFALEELDIEPIYVSRKTSPETLSYNQLDAKIFNEYHIIINCTPIGTSPNTDACPEIPYDFFSPKHIAYDLIYNPEETTFLKKAKERGAIIKNGLEMLQLQADKAWEIWNR